MTIIDLHRVNCFLLRKQHLTDDSKIDDIVRITRDIGGLHATGPTSPYLSLFARGKDFTKEALDQELYVKRNLGKIRCMRKTIYALPKEMIPIAFAATRKMSEVNSVNFMKTMGVTFDQYGSVSARILAILKGQGLTTSEIKKATQAEFNISSIVNLMCDRGLLMRGKPKGGWKSNVHTYYLFGEYFTGVDLEGIDETKARRLLIERYLAAFGPVTETDIAWWAGFNKSDVRQILKDPRERVNEIKISGLEERHLLLSAQEEALRTSAVSRKHSVDLLPLLDPYLMGYKDRQRYLDHQFYHYVFDRSGNVTSTILVDGRITGVWEFAVEGRAVIKLLLFKKVEKDILAQICARAEETGKFIADGEVQMRECDSMTPLSERTAGGFMTPLKDS